MESSHPQTPNAWAHTSNINTNNIDTPAPPETPWAPETPWQGAPGEEPRWFEKEETIRRRHPYEHKLSAVVSIYKFYFLLNPAISLATTDEGHGRSILALGGT